jgi:hypothetical protein
MKLTKLTLLFLLINITTNYRDSDFEKFIGNNTARDFVSQYKTGTIKSIAKLREELEKNDIKISLRTLKTYLKKLNELEDGENTTTSTPFTPTTAPFIQGSFKKSLLSNKNIL